MKKNEENTQPINEWNKQVRKHLGQLWEYAYSSSAVFYTPNKLLRYSRKINATRAKQKALRGSNFAAL